MVFFGNKYSINQGSISFFNPAKIDPILNIDLETKARGVDVILTVSGPITKLNVSYRSDPPLQFSDIVALLATGPPADGFHAGGAGYGAVAEFSAAGGVGADRAGDREPGGGPAAAVFWGEPDQDRPVADGDYGQPGSASDH